VRPSIVPGEAVAISGCLLQILADHGPLTVGNTWNHAKVSPLTVGNTWNHTKVNH
jgi:hypothetical protein